jgi:hypothetical protein
MGIAVAEFSSSLDRGQRAAVLKKVGVVLVCGVCCLCWRKTIDFRNPFSYSVRAILHQRDGQFEQGEATVLVCSDAMARGMDLRVVDCVVSYDAPPFVKTYIHRCVRLLKGVPLCCILACCSGESAGWLTRLVSAAQRAQAPLARHAHC